MTMTYRVKCGQGRHSQTFAANLYAAKIAAAKIMAGNGGIPALIEEESWVPVCTLQPGEAEALLAEHRKKHGDERIPS
jgi:hypothetical protein